MYDDPRIIEIMNFLGTNYKEFLRQSKFKLKFKHNEATDLLSDVIDRFCNNLKKNPKYIDKYYHMYLDKKLFGYICKIIDNNIKFPTSPWRYNKTPNHLEFNEFVYIQEKQLDNNEEIIKKIYSYFENNKGKELFGNHWQYYRDIFLEYVQSDQTYIRIATKYNITESSVYNHIRYVKTIIREQLKKDGFSNKI